MPEPGRRRARRCDPLSGRSARWPYHCYGIWTDHDNDRHIAWVHATEDTTRRWTMAGIALNFLSDVDNARVRSAFGAEKYRRLVAVKDKYHPDNGFRMYQNVLPSTAQAGR